MISVYFLLIARKLENEGLRYGCKTKTCIIAKQNLYDLEFKFFIIGEWKVKKERELSEEDLFVDKGHEKD